MRPAHKPSQKLAQIARAATAHRIRAAREQAEREQCDRLTDWYTERGWCAERDSRPWWRRWLQSE